MTMWGVRGDSPLVTGAAIRHSPTAGNEARLVRAQTALADARDRLRAGCEAACVDALRTGALDSAALDPLILAVHDAAAEVESVSAASRPWRVCQTGPPRHTLAGVRAPGPGALRGRAWETQKG